MDAIGGQNVRVPDFECISAVFIKFFFFFIILKHMYSEAVWIGFQTL